MTTNDLNSRHTKGQWSETLGAGMIPSPFQLMDVVDQGSVGSCRLSSNI